MAFPKFLLERTSLSETAKIVYMILLNRAKLSQKNDGWTDERGHIFIYYPIKDIAAAIHKSEMSVKTALSALEKDKLIDRKHQGVGKANRIFVKIPVERKPTLRRTEKCLCGGKKAVCHEERYLSGSNKEKSNNELEKRKRKAYGKYQNVFLSDSDLALLQQTVPTFLEYIERLSEYTQLKGKHYANHAATIRKWYLEDNPAPPERKYIRKENESL
ncbi:MAG: replication initiator protein A, partial [Clostridia bacterium]|nr:replication initiator protein A [Clostridia bacterium]